MSDVIDIKSRKARKPRQNAPEAPESTGDKLTPKQEAFARALAVGKSQVDAHRAAYATGRYSDKQRYEEACKLAANPKVIQRVKDLQAPAVEACQVDVETLTRKLDQARALAIQTEQPGAAVAAIMGQAKLHGLLVEERKNARDPFEGWTAKQMQDALEQMKQAVERATAAETGG